MACMLRESRVGSLHGSKGLANVSKMPLARAGPPVDYTGAAETKLERYGFAKFVIIGGQA